MLYSIGVGDIDGLGGLCHHRCWGDCTEGDRDYTVGCDSSCGTDGCEVDAAAAGEPLEGGTVTVGWTGNVDTGDEFARSARGLPGAFKEVTDRDDPFAIGAANRDRGVM